jgi:hypothetical protein
MCLVGHLERAWKEKSLFSKEKLSEIPFPTMNGAHPTARLTGRQKLLEGIEESTEKRGK